MRRLYRRMVDVRQCRARRRTAQARRLNQVRSNAYHVFEAAALTAVTCGAIAVHLASLG
jgi:hypothetical protein